MHLDIKAYCYRIMFVILLLSLCSQVSAATLAVFPMLDFTKDANGVNFTLTEAVRQKAAEHGFDVLPDNEVMSFMVRHRIRHLGILSSYEISNLKKELAVDYILLGTVCQLARKPTAKVSISLQLIRTIDEEIVWSTIKDLHEDDLISLLAIAEPESLNDLYVEYFSTLLNTIPTETVSTADELSEIGLLSVQMHPIYAKPSERIELSARIYAVTDKESIPKIYLQINDKTYPVDMDEDSFFFKSSWQAQESPGKYRVDLVAEYPSGRKQVVNLSEYTVDNLAPKVIVNVIGKVIDGTVTFNRDLVISLKLAVPELLNKWEVSVYDEDEDKMLDFSGSGILPERVYWNGTLSSAEVAPDGKYRIRVTVWDRAENMNFEEKFVDLRNNNPEVGIIVERNAQGVSLTFDNKNEYPLEFWWVKVYEQKGALVMMKVGEDFPATVDIEYDFEKKGDTLELIVAAQDVYGNRGGRRVKDVLNLNVGRVEVEYVQEKDWLENF